MEMVGNGSITFTFTIIFPFLFLPAEREFIQSKTMTIKDIKKGKVKKWKRGKVNLGFAVGSRLWTFSFYAAAWESIERVGEIRNKK